MNIRERTFGEIVVLDLEAPGAGDYSTELFVPQVQDLLNSGKRFIVLNMSGLRWINSSSLGALLGARRKVDESGGSIVIAEPSARVSEIMRVVGMHQIWKIYPTEEEAIGSFGQEAAG